MPENSGRSPLRASLMRYARRRYGTKPEYLWLSMPDYAVLRHDDNRKWYALFMTVPREKLGLPGGGAADILELKCDPILAGTMSGEDGVLPAYHMHRPSWITLLLDGTVDRKRLCFLLDRSFELTAPRGSIKRGPRSWLIPANPAYFDIEQDLAENNDTMLWKQSSSVAVGDTVYIYVAAPVSAIRYQCSVLEADIPYNFTSGRVHMSRVMRLKLERQFPEGSLGLGVLRSHGVSSVRGPRYAPESLLEEISAVSRRSPRK